LGRLSWLVATGLDRGKFFSKLHQICCDHFCEFCHKFSRLYRRENSHGVDASFFVNFYCNLYHIFSATTRYWAVCRDNLLRSSRDASNLLRAFLRLCRVFAASIFVCLLWVFPRLFSKNLTLHLPRPYKRW
jgi:hypothetical protein